MIPGIGAAAFSTQQGGLSNRWRLNMTAKPVGGSYFSACEVEMRTVPGGMNRAIGGTAAASSFQATGGGVPAGGWSPAMAFDGIKTSASAWTAVDASTPQWLEYEFPDPVTINEIVLSTKHNDPGGTPSTFDVQYWNGTTWVTHWTETWLSPAQPNASGSSKDLVFTKSKGLRKWRVNITANGGGWVSLYEVEFRAAIAGTSLNPNCFPATNYTATTGYLLFDGDYVVQWQSGSASKPVIVGAYFNKDVPAIGEIIIKGGATAADSPTAGDVQYYDEALGVWVTAWSFAGLTWAAGETKSVTPRPLIDAQWDNVVLLCGFEGADGTTVFTDQSPSARTITAVGNAQCDTAIALAGSSSLLLDGTGDYTTTPGSGFNIANSDFTAEALIRIGTAKAAQAIMSKRVASGLASEFWFYINNGNEIAAQFLSGTGSVLNLTSGTGLTFAVGVTYHVALVRNGMNAKIFVDGVQVATGNLSGAVPTGTQAFLIGRDAFNTTRDFSGHIDEVRITKAVRYVGDFDVPGFPLPRSKYAP